ncbi:TlpA disulfide reductase family protein [Echinicola jeungdonensis]|uniref:TlpA family protein disulfide reductase n=1 Tax=Echinicola jeungdonensis TaxID=709343 RepID=UPI0025B48536|nr:TlpA disulfide reductase family protein [Echinicola jeungdonensis]MDN3671355.1 TlpA disulfide reductase family protein [Echinicola jeungdonensis]
MNYKISILVLYLISLPLWAQGQTESMDSKGMELPDFTLVDLEGNTISSEDFKGGYLVIHIATTWCPFCNAEAPYLEELAQNYRNKNVKVLIIDVKEPASLVKRKTARPFQFSFPVILDEDGTGRQVLPLRTYCPTWPGDEVMLASNILVDLEGNIQYMSLLDSKNFDAKLLGLKAKLDELLSEN